MSDNRFVVPTHYVLAQSGVQVTHTGDTAEFALATITVPAGAIGANGSLRITAIYSRAGGVANTLLARIRYTTITGTTFLSRTMQTTDESWKGQADIFNRNSQSSQVSQSTAGQGGFANSTTDEVTASIDTSVATTIVLSGQCTNAADTIGLEAYRVEVMYGA